MRYEDWDVLLFPGTGASAPSHIPMKEFKTTAVAVRDRSLENCQITRPNSTSPLLHCFVPTLEDNAPMQISVHSWTPKRFHYKPVPTAGASLRQLWQVKVIVDGEVVCVETCDEDTSWPKVLTHANWSESRGEPARDAMPLTFPKFRQHVMYQRLWAAHDHVGRVQVIIAEGYTTPDQNGEPDFTKMANHAMFNFQPTPMDVMQMTRIAWPNKQMYMEALYMDDLPHNVQANRPLHSRNASNSSIRSSPRSTMPGPPPPTPNMDTFDSRSTSAYSTIPFNALPLSMKQPTYAGLDSTKPVQVRLPSDQFTRLLGALNPHSAASDSSSMPPPPLPSTHAALSGNADRQDRRFANASDISMHTDYQSFPDCTSMDEQGRLVHVPAHAVRSRKEGSVDMTNRDFLSNILNPTSPQVGLESTPAKRSSLVSSSPASGDKPRKRTRASLKNLTVNDDGSPEKNDSKANQDVDIKPVRKVSRTASDKENVPLADEMIVDE